MVFQNYEVRKERVQAACVSLEEQERAVLLERRGTPLFKGPMEKLRSIKERYQLTWLELRAVIYAL